MQCMQRHQRYPHPLLNILSFPYLTIVRVKYKERMQRDQVVTIDCKYHRNMSSSSSPSPSMLFLDTLPLPLPIPLQLPLPAPQHSFRICRHFIPFFDHAHNCCNKQYRQGHFKRIQVTREERQNGSRRSTKVNTGQRESMRSTSDFSGATSTQSATGLRGTQVNGLNQS